MRYTKTCWNQIKKQVQAIAPEFHNLVEPLQPDSNLPIYVFSYEYGDLIGDNKSIFIPSELKQMRLGSSETPKEVMTDLGYGASTCPLGMTLEKNFEWYNTRNFTPMYLDPPGTVFGLGHVIKVINPEENFLPNGKLAMLAGARSTFLLPKVANTKKHEKIQNLYGVTSPAPSTYQEHFNTFLDISKNKRSIDNNWKAKILFFSKGWVDNINSKPEWNCLKDYFRDTSEYRSRYHSAMPLHEDTFMLLAEKNTYCQTSFIERTAKYLTEVMIGVRLGYGPATNEDSVPLKLIEDCYSDVYELESSPIVMVPSYYSPKSNKPVYYSLNFPTIELKTDKLINYQSILKSLKKIKSVINETYLPSFREPIQDVEGTLFETRANCSTFRFIHSNTNSDNNYLSPTDIHKFDDRFKERKISFKSPFFQGCISISSITAS